MEFTAAECAAIIDMRDKQGLTWQRIAQFLKRPTGSCIRAKHKQITAEAACLLSGYKPRSRPCLGCKRDMFSTHAGHRMCEVCRGSSGNVSPLEPTSDIGALHFTGIKAADIGGALYDRSQRQ